MNFQEVVHLVRRRSAAVARLQWFSGEPNGRSHECTSEASRSRAEWCAPLLAAASPKHKPPAGSAPYPRRLPSASPASANSAPIARRQTVRRSASSSRHFGNGPTRPPSRPRTSVEMSRQGGCITTTGTAPHASVSGKSPISRLGLTVLQPQRHHF